MIECPYCKDKGMTKVRKNKTRQCKRIFYFLMMGLLMLTCFIFVLFFLILYGVVCARKHRGRINWFDKDKGCCCFKGLFKGGGKCAPKVTFFHYCQKCNKVIGSSA